MMLESEVETFEGKIRMFATEFPFDGSVPARDSEDGACCSGRNKVISVGAFVDGIDVTVGLSVLESLYSAYKQTYK